MTALATTSVPTLVDAVAFINNASKEDLDRLFAAINLRDRALREEQAAAVAVGMTAKIADIKPKYLSGLTGTVESIQGSSAAFRLDKASTNRLRWSRTKYFISPDVEEYILRGVPLSCIRPA